jgi:hypothetical protein
MIYKYKCNDEILEVWVSPYKYHGHVTVYDKTGHDVKIQEDEQGEFFVWKDTNININDWIKISMKELKEMIDKKEFVTSDMLCQAILSDGIDNARFMVPLNTVSLCMFDIALIDCDNFKDTLCKIKEEWNREVRQDYKLVLVPVENDETVESRHEYYTSDMIQLIQEGIIKIII